MRPRTRMMMMANMGGDRAEGRFRDRSGRERYNDGRYAPRSEGGDYDERRRYADPRGYERERPMEHHREFAQTQKTVGKIGFAKEHDEGMSWEMAREWVDGMKNSDGSRGAKWHIDQIEQLMKKKHIDCDPMEFWAVMNSLYSDFGKTMKDFGCATIDLFAALTLAWLEDEDAVDDKAEAYFEHIVK